jgi:hypothetical protein
MVAGAAFNQLHTDAQSRVASPNAAFEQVADAKFAPHFGQFGSGWRVT